MNIVNISKSEKKTNLSKKRINRIKLHLKQDIHSGGSIKRRVYKNIKAIHCKRKDLKGKISMLPVQKLAFSLYISRSCQYMMENIQNLWNFSIKIGSSTSLPFVSEPIISFSLKKPLETMVTQNPTKTLPSAKEGIKEGKLDVKFLSYISCLWDNEHQSHKI